MRGHNLICGGVGELGGVGYNMIFYILLQKASTPNITESTQNDERSAPKKSVSSPPPHACWCSKRVDNSNPLSKDDHTLPFLMKRQESGGRYELCAESS